MKSSSNYYKTTYERFDNNSYFKSYATTNRAQPETILDNVNSNIISDADYYTMFKSVVKNKKKQKS